MYEKQKWMDGSILFGEHFKKNQFYSVNSGECLFFYKYIGILHILNDKTYSHRFYVVRVRPKNGVRKTNKENTKCQTCVYAHILYTIDKQRII